MVYCYPEAIFIFHFSNFLQVFYQNLFKQSTTQTSNLNATFGFKMKLAKVKNDTKPIRIRYEKHKFQEQTGGEAVEQEKQ